jgi:hypothetical protein
MTKAILGGFSRWLITRNNAASLAPTNVAVNATGSAHMKHNVSKMGYDFAKPL